MEEFKARSRLQRLEKGQPDCSAAASAVSKATVADPRSQAPAQEAAQEPGSDELDDEAVQEVEQELEEEAAALGAWARSQGPGEEQGEVHADTAAAEPWSSGRQAQPRETSQDDPDDFDFDFG